MNCYLYRLFLIKLFKKEKYINENYDSMQEYPWAEYPNYTTFKNGILPAYHMNKEHWITILLDGTVSKEKICELIDISYELTGKI